MKILGSYTFIYILSFLLSFTSCIGQSEPKNAFNGISTIKKNYFITKYPQEFFSVQCALQDKAGNMWFGTGGNGIYVYDGSSFLNFTHLDGLKHDDILCCMEDKSGRIWFGTRNGLIIYKPSGTIPSKKDFSNVLIMANVVNASDHKKVPYIYHTADNFVWSIMQDKNDKIWFSTNNGIYTHVPGDFGENGIPLFIPFLENATIQNKDSLHLKDVLSMLQDKKGNIWFASGYMKGEGIVCFDGTSLTNFKPDGISFFRSIIETRKGDILFLNPFKGIYSYNAGLNDSVSQGKSFSNYTDKIGLKKDTIIAMLEDKTGNMWIGTNSDNMWDGGIGGAWRYDGQSLKLFTIKDGLSHNCIFCIREDKDGNIWFGTRFTGLCRYDGKSFVDFTDR